MKLLLFLFFFLTLFQLTTSQVNTLENTETLLPNTSEMNQPEDDSKDEESDDSDSVSQSENNTENNNENNTENNNNENESESYYIGEETMNTNIYGLIIGFGMNLIYFFFVALVIPFRVLCKCCFSKWKTCTCGTLIGLIGTCYLIFCVIFSNVIFQNIEITVFDFTAESYDIVNRDTFDIDTIMTSYSLISTVLSVFAFMSLAIATVFITVKRKPNKNLYVSTLFWIVGICCSVGACYVGYLYLKDYPYDYPNLTVEKEKNDVLMYELAYLFFYSAGYSAFGNGVMCILGLILLVCYGIHYCCKYKRHRRRHYYEENEYYEEKRCCGCFTCSSCCRCSSLCSCDWCDCCDCCCCCCCSSKKSKKHKKAKKTQQTHPVPMGYNPNYNIGDYDYKPKKKKKNAKVKYKNKKDYDTFTLDNFNLVIEIDSLSSTSSSD